MKKIIIFLIILFTLSSCKGLITEPGMLMRPPKAAGNLSGLEDELLEAIGDDIKFLYPAEGKYKTPCIEYDIDGDGVDEVLVFYEGVRSEADEIKPHMMLLAFRNGNWNAIYDTSIEGASVASVDFVDITGNGVCDVLVGVSQFSAREKELYIYEYNSDMLSKKFSEPYSQYIICELLGGDEKQVLTLSLTKTVIIDEISTTTNANAKLFQYKNDKYVLFGEAALDKNAGEILSVQSSKLSPVQNCIYIDSLKNDSLITDLITVSDKILLNLFIMPDTAESDIVRRDVPMLCRDIDDDGYYEIPLMILQPGSPKTGKDRRYFTLWRKFDGLFFKEVFLTDTNYFLGYYIIIPDSFTNHVMVLADNAKNISEYYLWDTAQSKPGELFMTVIIFSENDFKNSQGYKKLYEKNGKVYAVKYENVDSEFVLSHEYMLENFRVY